MNSVPEIVAVVVAATIAAFGVRYVRNNAIAAGLLDIPNERSSHETPVPRGGGIGIVVGVVLGVAELYLAGRVPLTALLVTVTAAFLIGGVGFIDDRRDVSARARIVVHFAAAFLAIFWVANPVAGGSLETATFALAVIFAIGIVWALNLYNFMDGIDGIALQEGVFISLAGASLLWSSGSPWLGVLLCIAASCAAVLCWNWAPAKVFLGDVGSGFLGFLLAVIGIATIAEVGLIPWLMLWGVFLVDATVTLFTRMLTGQRWYSAHRSHAYQCLARKTGSHAAVSGGALAINVLWLFPWAYLAHSQTISPLVCLTVALAPLAVAALKVRAGHPETGV